MIHLCLAYWVSAFHKIHSDVWYNGVATYYIWQLDRFSSPINFLFMKNSFIITLSTYFTLFFESLFPFLVWFRQTRYFFLVAGVLLHLGIYLTMMIYDFQILFIIIYGFFLKDEIFEYFYQKISRSSLYIKYSKFT